MKKIIIRCLLLIVFYNEVGQAQIIKDNVFVDRMGVSNSANGFLFNTILLGEKIETITSKDKIILYYANIGVLNPTQKKYKVEVIFVDAEGNIVIKGKLERGLESEEHIGADTFKHFLQTVGLNPKPGVLVPGQLIPLKDGCVYYVKLFFENKLIGVTKFTYEL